jgi:hypothetical protein
MTVDAADSTWRIYDNNGGVVAVLDNHHQAHRRVQGPQTGKAATCGTMSS